MNINLLTTIFIVGGLVLLAFLKLCNVITVNRKANIYFGFFLLLWSTFWLDELLFFNHLKKKDQIFFLIRFIQFFTPIAFYFSILFYINPTYKKRFSDLKFLIVPFFFLVFIVFKFFPDKSTLNLLIRYISPIHALYYLILSFLKIIKHQKKIEIFSSSKEFINLNWIKYIIYCLTVSAITIIIYSILMQQEVLNVYINLFFVFTVYFVAYFSIKQKELFPIGYISKEEVDNFKVHSVDNVTKSKLLNDAELEFYKNELLKLMTEEEKYLDPELNLIKLANFLSISGHQLSYIINNGYGENFFHFINKFRVQKAQELLKKEGYDKLTILAVGYEAGFNSKTSFNTTFKKIAGCTPSQYRKKYFRL